MSFRLVVVPKRAPVPGNGDPFEHGRSDEAVFDELPQRGRSASLRQFTADRHRGSTADATGHQCYGFDFYLQAVAKDLRSVRSQPVFASRYAGIAEDVRR